MWTLVVMGGGRVGALRAGAVLAVRQSAARTCCRRPALPTNSAPNARHISTSRGQRYHQRTTRPTAAPTAAAAAAAAAVAVAAAAAAACEWYVNSQSFTPIPQSAF